jgi:hypothetical protein
MSRKISKTEWKFEQGDRVEDRVSGLVGIITSRTEHLNGCRQYGINPGVDKDGKMVEGWSIDGEQLVLVDMGLNEKDPIVKKETGGAPTRLK